MSERQNVQFEQLLTWRKWSLALIVFVLGYLAYFLTLEKDGFFYELVHHIGLFVAAVVVVHFIYEVMVKRYERASALEEISKAINSTAENLFPAFRRWGFYGFSESLELKEVFTHLEKDDELFWLDTYAPSRHVIGPELVDALKRGAKVKMLAISPNCETAKFRAREITLVGFTERQFIGDLNLFIETMRESASALPPNGFELRLYDDLPCIPMYIHRRRGIPISGLTGFFLGLPSEHFAHIRWAHASGGMLDHFNSYFENKWNKANVTVSALAPGSTVPPTSPRYPGATVPAGKESTADDPALSRLKPSA